MQRLRHTVTALALATYAALATIPAAAQSTNPTATHWFKTGLSEKEPQKKIQAYQNAIEFDPLFVEALYNLGLAYKQQGDYQSAELYLRKAYAAKPDTKNELKLQILFEMATTYKRLGKLKYCEESLRRANSLATDPAMKAIVLLELGRLLYEQNRYEEAVAELHEGEKLSPANQEHFKKLIQLAGSATELQRLYAAAEKAKASGNLKEAKALLEQIRAKSPGYKNVEAKIAELDSLLNAETKKTTLAAVYEQAQKYAAEGKLEMAIASYENLLQQAGNYKDAKSKLETARQQLEQEQRNEKLEEEYANGMAALKTRNWTRAILAFEKVLEMDRTFRDARKWLAEAQSGLDRESTETIIARYYTDGVAAMNRNDLGGALAALEKVRKINPNYRNTAGLLAEVESVLQKKTAPGFTASGAASVNLDSLYQSALTALAREDWMQAVVTLEKVQLLKPNYREAVDRLAQARAHLSWAEKPAVEKNLQRGVADAAPGAGDQGYIYWGAGLVLVTVLGAVALSPANRARLHLLRGNYPAAASIYENLLARHPTRVKLYPALANIYLLLGRKDEKALKIFKTLLQLNLAIKNRDEIISIVAQNYLTEGRTDSDAIEVLESALKAEQHKQAK